MRSRLRRRDDRCRETVARLEVSSRTRVHRRRVGQVPRLGSPDERLGRLVVDAAECARVQEQLVKHASVHAVRLGRDGRLLRQDNVLRCGRIG